MRVLVLDANYTPVRIVSWERAVCLLYDNKCEVVEEFDEVLRSPSMSMRMPSIIRMRKVARNRKLSIKFSRNNMMLRDGGACAYCGDDTLAPHELNYDHVLPRSRGGKTNWENCVMSCYPCNARKADRTPAEAGMPLRKVPQKPRWLPVVHKKFDLKTVPESWRPWLAAA